MKKISIYIINIFLFMIIFSFIDFLSMHIPNANYNNATVKETFSIYKNFIQRNISKDEVDNQLINTDKVRKVENPDSKLKSIIIFGCSFAYGSDIEEDQTLSYKLGEQTKRPIYNRAQGGLSVQHMLYQLRSPEFYKLMKEPEYILYVFFDGQYSRMLYPCCSFCPICYTAFYKEDKMGNLQEQNKNFFNQKISFFHSIMDQVIYPYLITYDKYREKMDKLLYKHFIESKKEAEKKWPNSKFAIFFFDDTFYPETMKKLEENDFILITRKDYKINPYEEKYMNTLHKDHPCELFWDTVTPVIVDKLK